MKILFLSHYFYPHIGGVEKHVYEVAKNLISKKHEVVVATERYENDLKDKEDFGGIKIRRFEYPHEKIKGLISIWKWLWKNRDLIKQSDIIHCHDVFIWYLPFKFLFPFKKVFTTFHGWEGIYPIPFKNIILKRMASFFSAKTIAIGKYIEKYYGIKANKIIYGGTPNYGGVDKTENHDKKVKNYLVFLGRLEKDTGTPEFFKWLAKNNKYQVDFIGDGSLHEECLKYGRVLGFIDPTSFLKRASVCVPGGYLSYIEAKSLKCKTITFANNQLKEDYWSDIEKVKKIPTWEKVSNEYINLYNRFK